MKKKIIFIAAHYPNRSPGQRYRFEQYFKILQQNGYEIKLANIINEKDDKIFYSPGNSILKILLIVKFFLKRCVHVFEATQYDIIFIYREAFFMGGAFFETLFKWTGKKIVYDFDDAIWLPNVSDENKRWQFLKTTSKISSIIKMADCVIVGNDYLKTYASQFNKNITIIPSTIDLDYYQLLPKKKHDKIVIGWTGSGTTIQYFKLLELVFKKLMNKYPNQIEVCVYGSKNYCNEALKIQGIAWSSATEVETINGFDIGVMPLPDNKWTEGKCAMKGLQYMALEVATILSPVGVNKKIIVDGENGLLANDDEWFEKLEQLIINEALRKRLAANGRKTILKEYTSEVNAQKYLTVFHSLFDKSILLIN